VRADILLGTVTVFMAVLGGIVSAHTPTKRWLKIAYLAAFVLAGVLSIVLVIKISNENAAASQGLKNALNQLTYSTGENTRMTTLNTALQEKLLALTGTITKLSEENLLQATGSKGYCYVSPTAENASGLPLFVIGSKYPVYDVRVNIIEQRTEDSPETAIQRLKNPLLAFSLGNVSGQYVQITGYNLPVQRGRNNRFQINIYSRAALFTEYLVVTWNIGRWNIGIDLVRNGTAKWIMQRPENFPYLEEPIH
jgi:hypothetical protein